jgi:hypothetical protein
MLLESRHEFVPDMPASDTLAMCFSDAVGLGVRALVAADEGAVLDRFTGAVGPEITQHSLQVSPGLHISNTHFVGYLSHSCDPNCRLDMVRFELVARRDIAAGDLLTIDYAATEDVLHVQFACHCGADSCRHWITGRRDPVSAQGAAYLATLRGLVRRA